MFLRLSIYTILFLWYFFEVNLRFLRCRIVPKVDCVTNKRIIFWCLQKKFENITIKLRQHLILVNFMKDEKKMTNCMNNFISYTEKWIIDLLFKNNQTRYKLQMYGPFTDNCRSSNRMCSIKKMFWEMAQNLHENNCDGVSLLPLLKRDSDTSAFCKLWEIFKSLRIFKSNFHQGTPPMMLLLQTVARRSLEKLLILRCAEKH